jgi:glycosyltransferase involved in cell wall biosynthesis
LDGYLNLLSVCAYNDTNELCKGLESKEKMNIWYLNHYATPPLYEAPGRPYSLAINLEKLGHKVTVICAMCHHLRQSSAPLGDQYNCRNYDGVDYYHLPARPYQGNGLGRLLNMLDFARAIKNLSQKIDRKELQRPDVLVPSCVHPLVFPPAYKLAKKYNAKLIYEVRDIWPLSLVELDKVPSMHPIVLWFTCIERRAYRQADAVVSLLPNALEHMAPLGLDKRKFHYIPNGINRAEWETPSDPLPDEHQMVFQQLKKQGKLVVVYAGAHGPPNALDQILDLVKLNQEKNKPYHFVLIGDGIEKEKLIKRAREESISFVTFLPKISKRQVITALEPADVCFIGWEKRKIYKFGISPNKIGDYFMSAKPLLHAFDLTDNDPVQEAGAGISVEPYNIDKLEDALQRFCAMTQDERNAMGMKGRWYALKNLDWEILGKRYAEICESL